MDVPISIGVMLALGVSLFETVNHAEHAYFDSAVMLLFFLLAGRTLDHAMRRKTRAVAGNLAALKAETAHRIRRRRLVSVPVAALEAGDRMLVRPGERMPADGMVDRRLVRDRREPGHRRDRAARGRDRRASLCRQPQFRRHADAQGARRPAAAR